MLRRLNKKGQNTLEYVLLIVIVVGAFISIQWYLSRGVQGKMRDSGDSIGDQFDANLAKSNLTNYTESHQATTEDLNERRTEYVTGVGAPSEMVFMHPSYGGFTEQSGTAVEIVEPPTP